jgi:hypothetical protein
MLVERRWRDVQTFCNFRDGQLSSLAAKQSALPPIPAETGIRSLGRLIGGICKRSQGR